MSTRLNLAVLGSDGTVGGSGGSTLANPTRRFFAALPPYNVKGDCNTVTDASITSGTNVVNSPELTAADAGKACVFVAAGTAGAHLYGWIGTAAAGTASLVTAQGGTTPLNAGTTVASGGEFVYASDDTAARDLCVADAAAVGGTAVFPDAQMGVRTPLATSVACAVEGQGVRDVYGSDGSLGGAGSMNGAAFPSVAPYLKGSVFVMLAANTDIIQSTVAGSAFHLRRIGLRFAGRYLTTGHGVNSTPASGYGNVGGNWEDVHVFGHSAAKYAFLAVAVMNMRHAGLRAYGGGGMRLFNGTAPSQPGNITAIDCFYNCYIGGTSHAMHIDGSGAGGNWSGSTFENVDPQVNVPSPALAGVSAPTNAQQVLQTTTGPTMNSMIFLGAMGQSQVSGSNATYPNGGWCNRTNDPSNVVVGNTAMTSPANQTGQQNLTGRSMVAHNQFSLDPVAVATASTTLNGGTAAGATSIVVASATGITVGSVLQIDTGVNMEFTIVTSVAGTTIGVFATAGWGLAKAHLTAVNVSVGAACVFQQLNTTNVWPGRRFGALGLAIGSNPQLVSLPGLTIASALWYRLDYGNATRTWTEYVGSTG